mmetsp:Transcript_42301/g.104105  ORF Transcript_42301/g.104105 Transcript_42301/m.104105 type:complete len:138 (-) Transcript_42301:448-861(-)
MTMIACRCAALSQSSQRASACTMMASTISHGADGSSSSVRRAVRSATSTGSNGGGWNCLPLLPLLSQPPLPPLAHTATMTPLLPDPLPITKLTGTTQALGLYLLSCVGGATSIASNESVDFRHRRGAHEVAIKIECR